MNYCVVENGIIVNVIVSDESFAKSIGAIEWYDGAKIGDEYKPPITPSFEQDMMNMLVEQEYQITLLQLGL